MDLLLSINLLVFNLACEGLTEGSQDVDVVVLVDPQPGHVFLQIWAKMRKP